MKRITYISFGAGVQSTALLVCSNLGLHNVPKADVAIFADTGDEPSWVYENVERMREWSGIPVEVVQRSKLSEAFLSWTPGKQSPSLPVYTPGNDGRGAPLSRDCTLTFKVEPILRRVKEIAGIEKGQRAKGRLEAIALIGISLDEVTRMKPSRYAWAENRYPLVDAGLRRNDCRRIVLDAGLPEPLKSSCVFCPYHSDDFWAQLQTEHHEEWTKACDYDDAFRNAKRPGSAGPYFLHQSLIPLRELDFTKQLRLFPAREDEECEGGCFL